MTVLGVLSAIFFYGLFTGMVLGIVRRGRRVEEQLFVRREPTRGTPKV
jgi:hypothetical protein